MKKTILLLVFFSLLFLVIPGTSLFADFGIGSRIDYGLDLFAYPAALLEEEQDMAVIPVIPLLDMGFFGEFRLGPVNLGVGIRGLSLIVVNVFWPSIYAELNLWRFSLNARIGGGALYVFPVYLIAGPYFVPELSLWFNLVNIKNRVNLQLGTGAVTVLSPELIRDEVFRDFSNSVAYYLGFKASFDIPWVTWK